MDHVAHRSDCADPRRLSLAAAEVHLWRVDLDLSAAELAELAGRLSPDEAGRAARFHFERDRRRYTVCRATLRTLLSRYGCGDARRLRFDYGAQGKPSLGSTVGFNLAHSQGLALIAVAGGMVVGVDLEALRPLDDLAGIARQVCSQAEWQALSALPTAQRCEAFLRCWTRKEACAKALGTGLSARFEALEVGCAGVAAALDGWSLHDLSPAPAYVGALATRSQAGPIRHFGPEDLRIA